MTDPFSSPGAKTPPKPFTLTEGRREVRSFVLRQGRFTEAQQRAFDTQWPRFGLDYTGEPRDYDAVFGRSAPRVLEIGFGNGEALRFAARRGQGRKGGQVCVPQRVVGARQQHGHGASGLHGGDAVGRQVFDVVARQRTVARGQCRAPHVGQLLRMQLDGNAQLLRGLEHLLGLRQREGNAFAEHIHGIDKTFGRQRRQHLVANKVGVVLATSRFSSVFGRQRMRAEEGGAHRSAQRLAQAAGDAQLLAFMLQCQAIAGLATRDRHEQGVAALVQQGFVGHRARGDDAYHLAFHQALGQCRVADLLADRHRFAQRHKSGQVALAGMHRHPGHRDGRAPGTAALGQRDVEQPRGLACVVVEQLVEVPHPEEQQQVRVLRLGGEELLHKWRMVLPFLVRLGYTLVIQ